MKKTFIRLRRDGHDPLHVQLAEQFTDAIRRREWKYGEALPGIRAVAQQLGVSLETVQRAYHRLQEDGWIDSRTKRGTVVIANVVSSPIPLPGPQAEMQAEFAHELRRWASVPGIMAVSGGSRHADPELLRKLQSVAAEAVWLATSEESFDPFGLPALRSALQGWLTQQGVYADEHQICVVNGTQQALHLIASLVVDPEATVFVPELVYLAAQEVFRDFGAHIRTLPMGPDGIDLQPLQEALLTEQVCAVYAMPNGHYPTGWSWTKTQKETLLALAERHQFAVVEDDYFAGFYYGAQPPESLLAMAGEQVSVYYLSTFSHVTHPGFRLGLLVCPNVMVDRMRRAKFLADTHTSTVLQHMLLALFESGLLADALPGLRQRFRAHRDLAVESCRKWLPDSFSVHSPESGLSAWVAAPGKLGIPFFRACLEEHVLVMPDEVFALSEPADPGFQVNFAAVEPDVLDEGIRRIGRVLRRRMT